MSHVDQQLPNVALSRWWLKERALRGVERERKRDASSNGMRKPKNNGFAADDDDAAAKKGAPFFRCSFAYALPFGPATVAGPEPESMLGRGAGGRGENASGMGEKECGRRGGMRRWKSFSSKKKNPTLPSFRLFLSLVLALVAADSRACRC